MKTRSPLRYPGGKSRAVTKIVDKYIIPNIPKSKKVCSPVFGGGSIEIDLAKRGFRVYGYDAFPSLVNFWQVLLKNPNKLANSTEKELKVDRKDFDKIQENFRNTSAKYAKIKNAKIFYLLNRTSYSGTTLKHRIRSAIYGLKQTNKVELVSKATYSITDNF